MSVRFAHSGKKVHANPFEGPNALIRLPKSIEEVEKLEGPLTEEQINDPNATEISIYEQDPTSPTGERLIEHIRTPEERRRHNEIHKMLMRAESDPNYDDRELNRHLLDDLMKDPYFADLTDELKDIKENFILTNKQQEAMLLDAQKADERQEKELIASLQLATYESLGGLIEDPMFAHARSELKDMQDVLPEIGKNDEEQNTAYELAMYKVLEKLGEDPNFDRKMAEWEAEHGPLTDPSSEESLEETLKSSNFDEPEELTKLLRQMKELMGSMGMESFENGDAIEKLEAEMEKVLNEDPLDEELDEAEIRGREMSFKELGNELLQLAKSTPAGGARNFNEDVDDEPVDAGLEAKVDAIMQDPKLMEKLMYIQKIIAEQQKQEPMELAPDPEKLETHRITSIQKRMQVARSDPQHCAAMQALHVHLAPPFNIAPALRIFNEAIEYAYIGANDDIRRILWRAYSKARSLPTFLQNLSDDAWDIMYYSQAVTWRSNQNREDHLKLLLQDLQSVGKDGPPTHPNAIAELRQ